MFMRAKKEVSGEHAALNDRGVITGSIRGRIPYIEQVVYEVHNK
jgi:hypothetical protein